ncbi:MAG: hypothetical protein ACETWG_08670 [Candidatus Neomarinimicrobiota bacterium]
MKALGYLLIVGGFLGGALTAVLETERVYWEIFLVAIVAGAAGVALVRLTTLRAAREAEALAANIQNIRQSLTRVVENITTLNREKESIHPYDFRHRIDELFPVDLTTFVEAREAIGHLYGLQAYADVMSIFASGERYLNRVWSASADGYIHECHTYLGKAREQFTAALDKLHELEPAAQA